MMRNICAILAVVIMLACGSTAHAVDFADNFESYVTGSVIQGQGDFIYWDNNFDGNSHALVSDAFAHTGTKSLMIGGHTDPSIYTDPVWQFADVGTGISPASSGLWTHTTWSYVPSSSVTGYADFNYMSGHPSPVWSGTPHLDMVASVVNGPNGGSLPMLRDQWVEVRLDLDLETRRGSIFYGGTLLSEYDWNGTEFDGIDYWAPTGAGAVYIDDISLTALTPTITWDNGGPGNYNAARWTGGPPNSPNDMTFAVLDGANTITVAAPGVAYNLSVQGGGEIAINAGQSLAVTTNTSFAGGTTLTLGDGATFSAGSGSIPAIAPTGDATIGATDGVLIGGGYDDSAPVATPRSLTKTGSGTFSLSADSVTAGQTTLVVKDGTLDMSGANPLGGAPAVDLDGGTLRVTPATTGFQPGLFVGTLPGNINETDPNPGNLGMDPLGPTIANTNTNDGNTTWVFSGFVHDIDGDGVLSFYENLDDKARLTVQGTPNVLNNDGWNAPTGGTVAVTPGGWVPFELRYSNGGGPGGAEADKGFGFGWSDDDTGGSNDRNLYSFEFNNPGAGVDLFGIPVFEPIDLTGTTFAVHSDSTLDLHTDKTALIGPTTIYAGTLTITGAGGGVTFQSGITVGAGAEKIGLNPEVTTDYGQINAAASPDVIIAKGGDGGWTLTADPVVNQSGSSWEVEGGTLELKGTNVSGGRPIKVSGGVLGIVGGLAALGTSEIELAGGTFALSIDYAASGTADALSEKYYQGQFGVGMIDPLGPGQGYLAEVPVYEGVYSDGTNLDFESADMIARSGNTVTGDQYGAVWHGSIIIGGDSPIQAGDVSFGTASDDGSTVWIDGLLVLDNNGDHGRREQTASVSLGPGAHEIYVGFYENGGGDNMELKVGQGAGLSYGAMQFFNPVAQPNLWSSEVINNGFNAAGLSSLVLKVTDDSTIIAPPANLTLPAPTMINGILTTTGAPVNFDGVTIDPNATRVGFNPQVATDYGTIANNSTRLEGLTIVKAGPSTWNLDAAPEGATGTANLTWEVQGGTLQIAGSAPLDGRPVVLSGGTLRFTAPIAVPDTDPGAVTDGMAIRFDASNGVTSDASGVATWANTAPGADATYSAAEDSLNGGVAPVWVNNAFNGNAVVRFDGSDQQRMSFLQYDDMQSVLWVLKEDADLDPSKRPPLLGDDDTFPFNRQVGRGPMWGGWAASEVRNGIAMLNGKQVVGRDVPPPSEPGIISLVLTGHLTGLGGVHAGPSDGVRTGVSQIGQDRFSAGRSWKGDFADIIIYDTQLTTAQVRQMTEHLAFRYGIGIEQNVDLSDVDVTVTEDSTLDLDLPFAVTLNSLTMHNGTFSTMGRTAGIEIGSTSFADGSETLGVNTAVPTALGAITADGVTPLVVTKTGTSDLILAEAGSGLGATTFVAADGNLVSYTAAGANPLGNAALVVNGGGFNLSALPAATSPVAYDHAVTVAGNGSIVASAGSDGHAGPMTVNVAATAGVTLEDGVVELKSGAGYELNVGPVTGTGGVLIQEGTVALSGAGNTMDRLTVAGGSATVAGATIGDLRVSEGALSASADLNVTTATITGGTVNTGGSQVIVSKSLRLGTPMLSIDEGNTFTAVSDDLLNRGDITLSGGTVSVTAGPSVAVAGDLLINVAAQDLTEGEVLTTWQNTGDLTGDFAATGTPTVTTVTDNDGLAVKAVRLDGGDWFEGPLSVPALEGNGNPRSIEAWVYDTSLDGEETIIAWGHRGGPDGSNMSFNYSTNTSWGAVGHWGGGPDLGWGVDGPPEVGVWHLLTYTNDGTTTRVYADGVEKNFEDSTLSTHANNPIRIGAQNGAQGGGGPSQIPTADYAAIRVHSGALSPEDVMANFEAGPVLSAAELVDMPEHNFTVTADTTLTSPSSEAILGNLTVQADVASLVLDGAAYSFQNVSIADGATVVGEMAVRGTLDIGNSVGTITIDDGELVFDNADDTAVYNAEVNLGSSAAAITADKIVITDSSGIHLDGTLAPKGIGRTSSGFFASGTSLTVVDNTAGGVLTGVAGGTPFEFAAVDPAPAADDSAHIGQGAFLRDVIYDRPNGFVTTAVELDVFVALGGDTDGDKKVWLSDWAALRANFGNTATDKTWTDGNFDPWVDGKVWLSDWAALRANFGNSDYTAAGASAVPEPGTIAMLLAALAGLAVAAWRRR